MALRPGTYEDHMPNLVAAIEKATSGRWFWYCSHRIDWSEIVGADLTKEASAEAWVGTMLDRKWPADFTGWFVAEGRRAQRQ